ncbi:hypothetical protein R5W23_001057 [Gemmata sp. JC673]|uniref:RHS repeat-associated core domain-containing protein n=1 Tax=Gemmata algarum TaxID=2975278 RepID=A0ABU5ET67_9BACT|nr:hypothetical protein [Gemmata algarum]MDY3558158.1 hypothetical protein [Gemmata algarum]
MARDRLELVLLSAAGCSVCSGGQGVFTYTYTTNSARGLLETNAWATKTVEALPDGSTNTLYTNAFGQVMLGGADGTSQWLSDTRYDADGRVVLEAGPTTVTGYSEGDADLVGFSGGNAAYLSDTVGLVTGYTYGTSTMATTSAAGDALGYLKQAAIRQGRPEPRSRSTRPRTS